MPNWYEFRLWYRGSPNPDALFAFKKTRLLATLELHNIEYSFILDEEKFILVRIELDEVCARKIQSSLEELVRSEDSPFTKVTLETWPPAEDAKSRILNARRRAGQIISFRGIPEGGWKIKGLATDGNWIADAEDFAREAEAFTIFMSRVAGEFTRAYLKEMPYRVNDRWLMSVFLHLLLDSISSWQNEENETRMFNYL